MNYTGNPRHLRVRSRSAQKEYHHRQRARTPAILETPRVDICKSFQTPAESRAGSEVQSIASSSSRGEDRFNAKRRRLLQQQDWLGLDIATPINIYDIRAAKEKKRLASGPFMRPLHLPPSELESIRATPVKREPPQVPYTPSLISHSSTSLHPQPTAPSIQSSQRGVPFIPSRHPTPFSAQNGSISSSSSSSGMTFNRSAFRQNSIPQESPVHEMDFFIPDPTDKEFNFFPRTTSMDVGTIWSLIEKRKQEDRELCYELGWGSQSGITGSQKSQRLSQCRDALSTSHGQISDITSRAEIVEKSRTGFSNLSRIDDTGSLNRNNILPDLLVAPSSGPITVSTEQTQTKCVERAQNNTKSSSTLSSLDEYDAAQPHIVPPQDRCDIASNVKTIMEGDGQSDGEADGISWF